MKSKYVVMSRDQNAAQNKNIKKGNKSFERTVKIFGNKPNKSKFHSGIN